MPFGKQAGCRARTGAGGSQKEGGAGARLTRTGEVPEAHVRPVERGREGSGKGQSREEAKRTRHGRPGGEGRERQWGFAGL